MKALIFLLLLVHASIHAAEVKTIDGATISGEVVRIIPATVEIKTQYGTSPIPLESLTPESQTLVLGKFSDAEKISKMKEALNEAGAVLEKLDPEEVARLRQVNELQEKLIENLKGQLALIEGKSNGPSGETNGVPNEVVSILKSNAAKTFPADPSTQLYFVKKNISAYLKLKEIPNSPAKIKAAKDFPNDFSTQLYFVTSASKAESDLSGIR